MKPNVQCEHDAVDMPLSPAQLDQLFRTLETDLLRTACDNTLLLTKHWLSQQGHDPMPVLAWLRRYGGYCDCEVLFNVAPKLEGK